MKRTIILFYILIALLLISWNPNKEVLYTEVKGYRIHNTVIDTDSVKFWVFQDENTWNQQFTVINPNEAKPINFKKSMIIAFAKHGNNDWEFKTKRVMELSGILTFEYTSKITTENTSYRSLAPYVISVEKQVVRYVVFKENGIKVKSIKL